MYFFVNKITFNDAMWISTFAVIGDNNFHFHNGATSVHISPNSLKNLINTHTNHGKRTGIPRLYIWHTHKITSFTRHCSAIGKEEHAIFPTPYFPGPGLQLTGTLLTVQNGLNHIITSRFDFEVPCLYTVLVRTKEFMTQITSHNTTNLTSKLKIYKIIIIICSNWTYPSINYV